MVIVCLEQATVKPQFEASSKAQFHVDDATWTRTCHNVTVAHT